MKNVAGQRTNDFQRSYMFYQGLVPSLLFAIRVSAAFQLMLFTSYHRNPPARVNLLVATAPMTSTTATVASARLASEYNFINSTPGEAQSRHPGLINTPS